MILVLIRGDLRGSQHRHYFAMTEGDDVLIVSPKREAEEPREISSRRMRREGRALAHL